MSQPNRLMDLLVDDDAEEEGDSEDNEELAALLMARAPTPPPQQAQAQTSVTTGAPSRAPQPYQHAHPARAFTPTPQTAAPAAPSAPGPRPAAASQPAGQPRAQPARPSVGRFPFGMMHQWCQDNLPPQDKAFKLAELTKTQNTYESQNINDPRALYSDIGKVIGTENLHKFSAYFQQELKKRTASTQKAQANTSQPMQQKPHQPYQQQRQQQPTMQQVQQQAAQQQMLRRPPGQHQAVPTSQAANNATIMQSLVYNAEQGWPGGAGPPGQQPQNPPQRPAGAPAASQGQQQPRPTQPWMSNGHPYTSSQAQRPQQPQQGTQVARGATFPAFTPTPGQQAAQPPGSVAASQAMTNFPSTTPGMRPHTPPPTGQIPNSSVAKNPAESAPSGQPAAKRAKKEKDDIDEENDIFKDTGVNLEEEENALLKNTERPPTVPRVVAPQRNEVPFLNLNPLQVKIEEIARKHGLSSVDPQVGVLLSRALDAHFTNVFGQLYAMARQRTDADRKRPGMIMSNNLRKKLHEINMRDVAAAQEREAKQPGAADEDTPATVGTKRKRDEDGQTKKGEKATKETEKQQASAANAAATAAFGKTKWNKWGAKGSAVGKPAEKASKKARTAADATAKEAKPQTAPSVGAKAPARAAAEAAKADPPRAADSGLAASRANAEMMTARLPDLIAVMEKDQMYQKSTLLYKLYSQLRD